MGVGGQHHAGSLYPREKPGTDCVGGWVGPGAGLDGCGKSRPHRDSIPGRQKPRKNKHKAKGKGKKVKFTLGQAT